MAALRDMYFYATPLIDYLIIFHVGDIVAVYIFVYTMRKIHYTICVLVQISWLLCFNAANVYITMA